MVRGGVGLEGEDGNLITRCTQRQVNKGAVRHQRQAAFLGPVSKTDTGVLGADDNPGAGKMRPAWCIWHNFRNWSKVGSWTPCSQIKRQHSGGGYMGSGLATTDSMAGGPQHPIQGGPGHGEGVQGVGGDRHVSRGRGGPPVPHHHVVRHGLRGATGAHRHAASGAHGGGAGWIGSSEHA